MKGMVRLVAVLVFLAGVIFAPRPAFAGIYCTSEELVGPKYGMICRSTCVFCVLQQTGEEVARDCYDNVCWFGGFREN